MSRSSAPNVPPPASPKVKLSRATSNGREFGLNRSVSLVLEDNAELAEKLNISLPKHQAGIGLKPHGSPETLKSIGEGADDEDVSDSDSAPDMLLSSRANILYGSDEICRKFNGRESIEYLLRKSDRKGTTTTHMQSADLFDYFSPLQRERQQQPNKLADVFMEGFVSLQETDVEGLVQFDPDDLLRRFPRTFRQHIYKVLPDRDSERPRRRKPLRIGLVLSGGPAPGGHNVIAGVYDYIKKMNPNSQLLGFKGGLDGFFKRDYIVVDDESMMRFRNSGGFDFFWSGRGRLNPGDEDLSRSVAEDLELNGVIIVGGDGSNSNAALLAEDYGQKNMECCVVGVPKTIDGDVKNAAIEVSFGFDTCAKVYSEQIGNLTTDVTCGQRVWHFVRVMGRSASHLVLECALQTRPNLVLIGEEIRRDKISLRTIVDKIANLIVERAQAPHNKPYGVVLIPEGLIEFIPEMSVLIEEMTGIMQDAPGSIFDAKKLTAETKKFWDWLPDTLHNDLLGDREATGYIQVAKIQTEMLLILLVQRELEAKNFQDINRINLMHHYFGYEGRCAMPSNFDAYYCYNLGATAACLIEHKKNGYMACIKDLIQDVSMWQPHGVPFPRLMNMIHQPHGVSFPGIIRQLTDLNSPVFKVFEKVRDEWRLGDYYRAPGPIQFSGPCANLTNYTIVCPTEEDLLAGDDIRMQAKNGEGRVMVPKRLGCYSPLQLERIKWVPSLPDLCSDPYAQFFPSTQFLPQDPYIRRQILLHYEELSRDNKFTVQEMRSDPEKILDSGLRVGICVLSRQSPGVNNIIWGAHERLKLSNGRLLGFFGIDGLINGHYLEITDDDLYPFKNLGGVDLIGRSTDHKLLQRSVRKEVLAQTKKLHLDGLVLIGSSLALTEATMLTDYFLQKKAHCKIVGIPTTASNNVLNELIETNIGFDTASKLYSSLIGNVLTDAASMPKYWHFVRLMGRQPSNEVLECALQCHPNVVIIAEEYAAGQKSLKDVVNDIADVVCRRADVVRRKKSVKQRNFGAVLIPDGLWHHLAEMRTLTKELDSILAEALQEDKFIDARNELLLRGSTKRASTDGQKWAAKLTPWSTAVWQTLPEFIRKELLVLSPELRDSFVEGEKFVAQLVKAELAERKEQGIFKGNFQYVTHYFGYQGRSAMPSVFDAQLAYTHGHLATIAIESGLTGHVTSVRGLCGPVKDWHLQAIPFNCLVTVVPVQQDIVLHPIINSTRANGEETQSLARDQPIIPNAEVSLQCKALRWMKVAKRGWEDQDRFCNPGPIQFTGNASLFYHRMLHEEQAAYLCRLHDVQAYLHRLSHACNFGVDENFLNMAYVSLHGLLALRYSSDDFSRLLKPLPGEEVQVMESKSQNSFREYVTPQSVERWASLGK